MTSDELTPRLCEYCGAPVPGRRRDARFCSTSHRVMAARKRKRQEEVHDWLVTNGGQEFTDHEHQDDDEHLDDDADRRTPEQREQDARFAAVIAGDDVGGMRSRHTPRRMPRETWRRWRAYGKRHGTEDPQQTADRIARHRAAEAASMARIDSMTAGRVQDRFDGRTAPNPGRNGAASRRLNQRYTEQPPPYGPGAQWDFQAESFNGGPYRSGRASGQRSRSADYQWAGLDDGFIY